MTRRAQSAAADLNQFYQLRDNVWHTGPVRLVNRMERASETPSSGARILLVNDDPSLRRLLEIVLHQAGYEVVIARAGQDAMEALHTGDPLHLMIAESELPQVNGSELARRARGVHPNIRVLLLAGRYLTEKPDGIDCELLHKPFMPEDFLRSVRKLLGQSAQ
jgi:DNA-binding response OmpR family regulator